MFFLLGFLMLACLWAAAGALANRQEDLQATTVPLQVLVFVPFFTAAYVYTPGTLLTTLSYIPFTAPIAMPRRLALGDAAWWEGVLRGTGRRRDRRPARRRGHPDLRTLAAPLGRPPRLGRRPRPARRGRRHPPSGRSLT